MCLDSLIQTIRAMIKFYLYTKNYTLVHFIFKGSQRVYIYTNIYKTYQSFRKLRFFTGR